MKKVSTTISFIAAWGIFWLWSSAAMAQTGELKTGKIAGKIVDASDGEPLIGCNIVLVGTKYGAASDLNGNFFVSNIPEGTYSVLFSYISYNKKTINPVTVTAGLTYNLQISLEPEGIMGESIVVEA
ncbi:carboxypeptidase-like regulatory domain-containing protein, partial [bacterium]|nr:carboxypeptidase-like regulatory domain-containing protein [bacterium]